ncbi:MAG: nucleotide exchange factor GrpE [Tissierella sp.]|uniref:nucleotide exchange factor GrpE n=1 Tax=Tissierella sp. TaxID=41274 RepID=UPI003F99056F
MIENEDIGKMDQPIDRPIKNNEVEGEDLSFDEKDLSKEESKNDQKLEDGSKVELEILDKYEEISKTMDGLNEKIDKMQTIFEQKIMHTEHEEKIVDQMHSELQRYKEDMYSQLVRPILLDIAMVRDSILRMAKTYRKKPEGEQDIPNKTFFDYSYDILDILEKNNVEIYDSEEGDAFVPLRHKVIKKIQTNVEDLHGKVCESMTSGYSYNNRVISAEKISMYNYIEDESRKDNMEEEK